MEKKKVIIFLSFFLLNFLLINFTFSASLSSYYEDLRFKIFYNFVKLIPDPLNRISYLNALAETILNTYSKSSFPEKEKFFKNYLLVLGEIKNNWETLSFTYSQYESFYNKSLELYINNLAKVRGEIKNKNAENLLVDILKIIIPKLDTKEGLNILTALLAKNNLNLKELKSEKEEGLLKDVKFEELIQIMRDFKTLVTEFENGQRVITSDYETFEKKILEIQDEVKKAQENIKQYKVVEFNENIKKIKENLNFIRQNSKKIK